MSCRQGLAVVVLLASVAPLAAQVVAPPAPARFDVEIRYRIRVTRNERIRQFLEMSRRFEAAGLERDAVDPEEVTNPDAERVRGVVPSAGLARLVADPAVQTVLARPEGFAVPEGDALTPVRITIAAGLRPERQQLLHEQTRDHLKRLGFVERVGYDHRNFTRINGAVPANQLDRLVTDVRWQPGGWLAPEFSPSDLPEPLRNVDPLRLVEVAADALPVEPDAVPPQVEAGLEKLSPELRAFLKAEDAAAKTTRLEVVLYDPLRAESPGWKMWLAGAGTVALEGQAGPVVTIRGPAGLARDLARLPQVASVRLPARAADVIPDGSAQPADAVTLTNLSALNRRGRGVAVAIIDSDFAGIRSTLARSLSGARWIDLTAETEVSLEPAPLPDDRIGRGTQAALAAALAAPEAQLILVRVAPDAAHQVISVGRYATGEAFRTDAMSVRYAELLLDNERLRQSRDAINAERRALAEDFSSDEATQQRRLDLQKRLVTQDQQEKAYEQRLSRFIKLEEALLTLGRVGVVACNLNWNAGYAVDGTGPLAAFLDGPARLNDRGRGRGALTWLQAAGDTQGQSWAGPWWDADGNGVLEFAPRNFPIPAGKWTRELNFLGWQPFSGSWSAELPAGATYRVTVQWTEAHDTGMAVDPARWRIPLNDVRPVVVRQRDPAGGRTASDDLVVVARPAPLAQMIDRTAAGATYEQTVEFTVDQPGRFAVRLEGRRASSTVPADVTLPPAAVKTGEVFPRVHVQAVDDAARAAGRPIFIDFRSGAGGTATPADAASAVVVGATDALGRPHAYSARGSVPALALVARPTFHAFDEFPFGATRARGTSVANGFAAGTVAAMLGAGGPASSDLRWLRIPEGGQLRVPPAWLQQLQNTTGLRERAAYLPSPLDRPTPRNR